MTDVKRLLADIAARRSRPAAPDATCGCTNDEDTNVPFVLCPEHERRWGPLSLDTLRSVVVDFERGLAEQRADIDALAAFVPDYEAAVGALERLLEAIQDASHGLFEEWPATKGAVQAEGILIGDLEPDIYNAGAALARLREKVPA